MAKNMTIGKASDLATARADFLARVEGWAGGQAARFAPVLDELIRWSDGNGLEYAPHPGIHDLVKYRLPGSDPFWAVVPRTGDGAKLALLYPRAPGAVAGRRPGRVGPHQRDRCQVRGEAGGGVHDADLGAIPPAGAGLDGPDT